LPLILTGEILSIPNPGDFEMDRNNRQIVITELPHGTLTENHFELRTSVRPQAGRVNS